MKPSFETRDVDLAATIISNLGLCPTRIQRLANGRDRIAFEADERIELIESLYLDGKVRVDPILFADVLRHLDSQLRNHPTDHHGPFNDLIH